MRTNAVESLFVILGPSGAGKSSFLRAGLLPRVRRDDRRFVPLPIVRPERAVLTGERGLAHAIHQLRDSLDLHEPVLGEIKTACRADHVEQVRGWLEEARQVARARLLDVPTDQPAPTLVLPVDQAEELFNTDAGPEAPRFRELLAALVQPGTGITPAMIVALTIRADRYEPLQVAPELAEVKTALFDDLKPLPPAGYKEVITGPARRASAAGPRLTVEPALVERLLAETAEGADALPLLALTLERLYHDFGDDGDLTVTEYEAMGGMAQVVQTEVDKLLAADPEQRQAQLDTLHDAFIPWLATINPDNDQPMRRLARWDDLPAASHPLNQAMVEKRLLVKDTRDGQIVVEVALESLLRQWRELAAWLRDEGQDLKDADGLERGAADWEASGHDEAWLLEGTRLAEAENLSTKAGFRDRLNHTHDYLQASRTRENQRLEAEKRHQQVELQAARDKQQAAEALAAAETHAKEEAQQHAAVLRKQSRRLKTVLVVTTVIAVVAVAGIVWASIAQHSASTRAKEASAIRLVAEGQLRGEFAVTVPVVGQLLGRTGRFGHSRPPDVDVGVSTVILPQYQTVLLLSGTGDPERTDMVTAKAGALAGFRRDYHACLDRRADALFELTDAVLCADGPVVSLPELSLTAEHRRGHGALYDGLACGQIDVGRLRGSLATLPLPRDPQDRSRLSATGIITADRTTSSGAATCGGRRP